MAAARRSDGRAGELRATEPVNWKDGVTPLALTTSAIDSDRAVDAGLSWVAARRVVHAALRVQSSSYDCIRVEYIGENILCNIISNKTRPPSWRWVVNANSCRSWCASVWLVARAVRTEMFTFNGHTPLIVFLSALKRPRSAAGSS